MKYFLIWTVINQRLQTTGVLVDEYSEDQLEMANKDCDTYLARPQTISVMLIHGTCIRAERA